MLSKNVIPHEGESFNHAIAGYSVLQLHLRISSDRVYQNTTTAAKLPLAQSLSRFHGLNSPTTVYPVSAPTAFPIHDRSGSNR